MSATSRVDKLLGPLTLTIIVLDGAANGITVAVPLLAYTLLRPQNPHIAGWIFTAFGIGAIVGSVLVVKLLDRFAPLRLASFGIVSRHTAALDRYSRTWRGPSSELRSWSAGMF